MTEKELKRKIAVLTLTERCNLSCVYCFEKAKANKAMSIEIAKKCVEYEFAHSEDYDEIEFDLFGGEPTLCIPVIQELVEWTENQNFSKPYLFFLETNGTLVHGEFQKWLVAHKGLVYAGLSLDGKPETHNRNRSNSYERIDIEFFVTNYPAQSVRMTVYDETLGSLAEDVIHLHKLGFADVVATFAHGSAWDKHKIEVVLPTELQKLCDFYLAHPEIPECSIFDMQLSSVPNSGRPIEKWCGTGTNMVSYDTDGARYPCHTFQSFTSPNAKAAECGVIDFAGITDYRDPECSACILESICPNCYGMNYVTNGDILKRDRGLCEIVKVRALAVSYLRARQIDENVKQLTPSELYRTITAIRAIQSSGISNSKLTEPRILE